MKRAQLVSLRKFLQIVNVVITATSIYLASHKYLWDNSNESTNNLNFSQATTNNIALNLMLCVESPLNDHANFDVKLNAHGMD
ncbi:CLUMA_CG004185, isoform A [Clunio marinus]|uniref:CLUMA_CG004185, isoform A n=1 Tax=Clunio marinus TaxID=568069 RepID=A0A1J1HQT1_9DIPT|nr:CLUMA_CG004185, isoform A [Clunio marinus]